jgi:predicted nucleic acid-binding protein
MCHAGGSKLDGREKIKSQSRGSQTRSEIDCFTEPRTRRVLPITEDVMLKWRRLVEEGRKIGHTFSQPDLSIAATARHYVLTIVSRDTSDFERARVTVFNPWVEAAPRERE